MANKGEFLAKYRDPRWQQVRLKVMERDGWNCRVCHSKTDTLNAHHSYYEFGRNPWDYPLDSLVTLCGECHEGEHANWECDGIKQALCSNGFWSVYQRSFLSGALNGNVGERALTDIEADEITRIVEAFAWSLRNELSGPANIAMRISKLSREAPSMLPGAR